MRNTTVKLAVVGLFSLFCLGCAVETVPLAPAVDASTQEMPPANDMSMTGDDASVVADASPDPDATPPELDSGASDADGVDASTATDQGPQMPDALPTNDGGSVADGAVLNDGAAPDGDIVDPGECVGVEPLVDDAPPEAQDPEVCMNCVGAPFPQWRRDDFQPLSCGFEQNYGLDSFQGHTTLVALFYAGCPYCQGQAQQLERMRIELGLRGHDVMMTAIGNVRGLDYQDRLADRCSFPLFQDVDDTPDDDISNNNAMEAMDGAVYDIYVYRPDGLLHVFFSGRGPIDTYLSEDAGYENVKAAIMAAMANEPYEAPFPAEEPMEEPMEDPDGND